MGRDVSSNWKAEHFKRRSMTTLLRARPTGLEIVAPFLGSETHPEGRIGYRGLARRNGRLGDIHSVDNRYDHNIDELMA
jgi:hypothetical protein